MASHPTDDQPPEAEGVEPPQNGEGHDAPATSESAEARIATLEAEKREIHDRFLRLAAEFENWKKRSRREQEESSARGREQLLKELLPALREALH